MFEPSDRDVIATIALHGILSNPVPGPHRIPTQAAKDAVAYADALINTLEATKKEPTEPGGGENGK